ncbi:MAG: hypothetical protein QNK19_09565 [Xanthomonadales bacterium]|nr:hypothetical protein [Xanthomonadales bacterium]
MKNYYRLMSLLLFLVFSMQVVAGPADTTGFVNSITEKGQCGHEGIGKLQYLKNSDKSGGYEVTVRTIEMHEGEKKETLKSIIIKAGGNKHLGCSFSEMMPLTTYERTVVSEVKNS